MRLNLREGSDADRNAAILSIGALGSGKTTLDQKLAYEAFLLGARVIDCDPKGDHRLHELPEVAPHVETIALRGERALRGMLDPLRIAPEHLRQDAADLVPLRPAAGALGGGLGGGGRRRRRRRLPRAREAPTCFEVVRALAAGRRGRPAGRQDARRSTPAPASTQLGFADPDVRLPGGRHAPGHLPADPRPPGAAAGRAARASTRRSSASASRSCG